MYEILKNELLKYESFSEDEWSVIQDKFSFRVLKKGDHYLEQGQICKSLGFVAKGFLRNYSIDIEGNELTTHFSYDKTFLVSFYSFKNQAPSFEYIKAQEDSQLLEIEYKDLQNLFTTLPKWGNLYRKLIEEAYACMEQRNYVLQNLSASKRYELLIQNAQPHILMKAQLGHIASYLGIKQETLSRIRKNIAQSTI